MARPNRIEFPGAFYHVFARGNNKQKIFHDTQDFTVYLDRIKRYHRRYEFILYAYVLMSNHIHFAIETCEIPLSKIMQGIQQSYAQYVHKKRGSVGHVFQGPYRAVIYDKEEFVLTLVRYIHRNPVEACLVERSEQYPWCSHSDYLNLTQCSFLNKKSVLELISSDKAKAIKMFSELVLKGQQSLEEFNFDDVKDRKIIGNKKFVKKIQDKIKNNLDVSEVDLNENLFLLRKKTLFEMLKIVTKQTKVSADSILGQSRLHEITEARRLFAFISAKYAGYRLGEISKFLKLDDTTISKMVKRIEDELKHNPILPEKLREIIQVLQARPQ